MALKFRKLRVRTPTIRLNPPTFGSGLIGLTNITLASSKTYGIDSALKSYSVTYDAGTDTMRSEVRSGDAPGGPNGVNDRAEISQAERDLIPVGQLVHLDFYLTLEAGYPVNSAAWVTLCQIHDISTGGDFSRMNPIGIGLQSADRLQIYCVHGPFASRVFEQLYVSPANLVKGQAYHIQVDVLATPTSDGYMNAYLDGVQVANYSGPTVFDDTSQLYVKAGVYRETNANSYAAKYRAFTYSAEIVAPSVPDGFQFLTDGYGNQFLGADGATLLYGKAA